MSPRRGDPRAKEVSASGPPTWLIAAGIFIVVAVAAVALFTLQSPAKPAPATTGSSTTSSGRTQGDPNAKLEMIEWSDFQ